MLYPVNGALISQLGLGHSVCMTKCVRPAQECVMDTRPDKLRDKQEDRCQEVTVMCLPAYESHTKQIDEWLLFGNSFLRTADLFMLNNIQETV